MVRSPIRLVYPSVNEAERTLILVAVGAAALLLPAVMAWSARRASRLSIRVEALQPWPAVVMFTSDDCDSCGPVRDVVQQLTPAGALREVVYQGDAATFTAAGVGEVPVVVVLDRVGTTVARFDGQIVSRRLLGALRRAGLNG